MAAAGDGQTRPGQTCCRCLPPCPLPPAGGASSSSLRVSGSGAGLPGCGPAASESHAPCACLPVSPLRPAALVPLCLIPPLLQTPSSSAWARQPCCALSPTSGARLGCLLRPARTRPSPPRSTVLPCCAKTPSLALSTAPPSALNLPLPPPSNPHSPYLSGSFSPFFALFPPYLCSLRLRQPPVGCLHVPLLYCTATLFPMPLASSQGTIRSKVNRWGAQCRQAGRVLPPCRSLGCRWLARSRRPPPPLSVKQRGHHGGREGLCVAVGGACALGRPLPRLGDGRGGGRLPVGQRGEGALAARLDLLRGCGRGAEQDAVRRWSADGIFLESSAGSS